MIIKFKFPDKFVPEEKEFLWYCAIKLFKGNIINRDEAMNMMNIKNEEQFNSLYNIFEKRFKKICGINITQSDFEENIMQCA